MANIVRFFDNNKFQFGIERDSKMSPGRALTALGECLKSYYETYSSDTSQPINYFYKCIAGENELPDKSNVAVIPDLSCSHEYLIRYYSSIFFGQLFLELFIVDLLDKVSPIICRGNFKDNELLSQLADAANQASIEKTIQFTQVLKRLRIVLKNSDLLESHPFLKKYLFLLQSEAALHLMKDLRNDIVHSGQKILYHYAYELLFINHFLPLVKNFIAHEENSVPLNRNMHCNLNVLDELCRFPLPENYLTPKNYDQLKQSLQRINHFKELGRASLSNPLFMGEWGDGLLKQQLFEHNKFKKDIPEMQAKLICESRNVETIYDCPCCGAKAFIPMDIGDNQIPLKVSCLLCTYNIESFIGEPNRFGIMSESVFRN